MERGQSPTVSGAPDSVHTETKRRRDSLPRTFPPSSIQSVLLRAYDQNLYLRLDRISQDLGNTNYSIHLPRTAFDRKDSAKVVVTALRALGIHEAHANERNDICAHGFKIRFPSYILRSYRTYLATRVAFWSLILAVLASKSDSVQTLIRISVQDRKQPGVSPWHDVDFDTT